MKSLKELSKIQFGCYDSALPKGEILYLQLKNFDENNQFLGNVDAFVKEDEKYGSYSQFTSIPATIMANGRR